MNISFNLSTAASTFQYFRLRYLYVDCPFYLLASTMPLLSSLRFIQPQERDSQPSKAVMLARSGRKAGDRNGDDAGDEGDDEHETHRDGYR